MRSNDEQFMLWRVEPDGEDPFVYFEKKRGYKPKQVIMGSGVDIEIPNYVSRIPGTAQTGHILMR